MFLKFGDYTLNVLKGINLFYIELFYQFLRDILATFKGFPGVIFATTYSLL